MDIRRIKRADIDKLRWDSCVHYAFNGNVYGYTWYLDNVADEWEGLVEGEYQSVFPLVWNDKLLAYKQLYQPFFSQQLGLYTVRALSDKRLQDFLNHIPETYKKIDIQLNEWNNVHAIKDFEVLPKTNLLLRLYRPYDAIREGYSTNLKRNIKKALKHNLRLTTNVKPETLVAMFKAHQGKNIPDMPEAAYHAAHRIIYNCLHRGIGFISGVEDEEGVLCAAAFFIYSHGRIINLLPSSTPKGRAVSAMPLILDTLIQSHAERRLVLDFEGSMIESIAKFYKSFGAEAITYPRIKRNNLPFWLKWFIK